MNIIAKTIKSYIGSAEMSDEEFIEHYGMPRRSGRYPWGSGKDPYQHSIDFLGRIQQLKDKGWKETPENIKNDFGMSIREYRAEKSLCVNARRAHLVDTAERLRDKEGLTTSQIARKMNIAPSSVTSLFDDKSKSRMYQAENTANFLKERMKESGYKMLDVGESAELYTPLNVSRTMFDTALYMLESQGYGVYSNRVPQATDKTKMTTQKVLCDKDIKPPPGKKTPKEIYDYDKIGTITDFISRDGGKTFEKKFNYPASMDSKRIKVMLKDEVGADGLKGEDKDGLIEIRRNVPDLSLGESRYSQVRILVDGNKYLKGMAVYSDNIPDGYDIVFNSNKLKREDAFKKIKNDPDNPFGSAIKDADQGGQYWYNDPKTGKKKLGLINKRADEGDWTEWKDALPSQFLSKQPIQMAKKQLNLAKATSEDEFDKIMSLTNPTVKKYYLKKFSEKCDKAAVDLQAASLPGQKYHVIIPVNSLGEKEVFAPQYKDGTKVALIRYPHGGTFEIPILTVNNKNQLANKIIGKQSIDAIGIKKSVADRLSGADFDGDTVMVIPTHDRKGKVKIQSTDELKGLKGFDPKMEYGTELRLDKNGKELGYYRNGVKIKTMNNTQNEMGKISNLITDMTLGGANENELARAVRHSMVVIDAEKHKLDYHSSERDNNIQELKAKYQRSIDENGNIKIGGASTLISKSKGQLDVLKRRGQPKTNIKGKSWYDPSKPEGALLYTQADNKDLYYAESSLDRKNKTNTLVLTNGKRITYSLTDPAAVKKYTPVMHIDNKTGDISFTNKDGTLSYRKKARTVKSTRMAETDDANTLVSPNKHAMELVYADYANSMKALANKARKELETTPSLKYNPTSKKIYAKEISSLESRLNEAMKNKVKERAALRLTSSEMKKRLDNDPEMKAEEQRKAAQRTVSKYRNEFGTIARRNRALTISDKEWEAIQAGAISENKLKTILQYTDPDSLRERAMPTNRREVSQAQINRIKALATSNFTLKQIAEKMNMSTSSVSKYLKGE